MLHDGINLAVNDRQRYEHLGSVVGRHDDGMTIGHRVGELVDSNSEVTDAEEKGTCTAALLCPSRQLTHSGTCSPCHQEYEGDVEWHKHMQDACKCQSC